ncbi:hypothetical protein AB0I45_03700 [Brevibacterium sp. NPDC049920]|uniref:hypothetical protein n=1 Tax=Brevibacterium sp. NPDC049920 TaxID=3155279 RepID=UPI0033DB3EA5
MTADPEPGAGSAEQRRTLLAMTLIQIVAGIGLVVAMIVWFPEFTGIFALLAWACGAVGVVSVLHGLFVLLPTVLRERRGPVS